MFDCISFVLKKNLKRLFLLWPIQFCTPEQFHSSSIKSLCQWAEKRNQRGTKTRRGFLAASNSVPCPDTSFLPNIGGELNLSLLVLLPIWTSNTERRGIGRGGIKSIVKRFSCVEVSTERRGIWTKTEAVIISRHFSAVQCCTVFARKRSSSRIGLYLLEKS